MKLEKDGDERVCVCVLTPGASLAHVHSRLQAALLRKEMGQVMEDTGQLEHILIGRHIPQLQFGLVCHTHTHTHGRTHARRHGAHTHTHTHRGQKGIKMFYQKSHIIINVVKMRMDATKGVIHVQYI